MFNHAQPTSSSAAASTHGAATPSLELLEARRLRDALRDLLRKEQAAMADFLVALANFDRRRGWEALGHASLFAFLHVELRLSNAAAYWRMSAVRLLHRFPDLIGPLGDGRLCLSTTAELAKVLTEENRAEVMPRFLGLSAREAREVVAELQPRQAPATRTVVTRVNCVPVARVVVHGQPQPTLDLALVPANAPALANTPATEARSGMASATAAEFQSLAQSSGPLQHPNMAPPSQLRTSEVDFGGGARMVAAPDEIEPLSAERRRVHVNVSKEFVKKLKTARAGLSHAIRGATLEQVLEAALDLLLEKQAKARGQVKKPRTTIAETPPPLALLPTEPAATKPTSTEPPSAALPAAEPPPPRRTGPREAIPAAVRRAVWERDGGRCTWPLDAGGCCGSTHRLELDHVVPWALGGESTPANLRLVCGRHNRVAARRAFGTRCVERATRRRAPSGR